MRVLLLFLLIPVWNSIVFAQTGKEVRDKAINAAARILDMGSVTFDVHVKAELGITIKQHFDGLVSVQKLGKQKRLSYGVGNWGAPGRPGEIAERFAAASGSPLPVIDSFDGKYTYLYRPGSRLLRKQPSVEFQCPKPFGSVFPEGWVSVAGLYTVNVGFLLSQKGIEEREPTAPESPWVFFHEYPDTNAFKRIEIKVDPASGFHVVEIKTLGGLGDSKVEFEWEEKEGKWFPKKARIADYRGYKVEWEIQTIDFRASAISEPFSLTDKEMPFGTRVVVLSNEENGRRHSKVHYVGGPEGKLEHQLRERAIAKLRRDLKK